MGKIFVLSSLLMQHTHTPQSRGGKKEGERGKRGREEGECGINE